MAEKCVSTPKETTFMSDICGRRFSRKSNLMRHLHCHLGSKPHECQICDRRFLRMDELKQHLLIHDE
ncbi:hypothetical protein CEXT_567411 [Caerostris extrusa]|uniref:C2H2-type domain-containing protein n=1 Tax=Caerostris extrusa TaxID=172846 RepID=A0AAV4QCX5_CAEEX|nr:hypothetical protein CEXT_567411 [Caerostris extrusa]